MLTKKHSVVLVVFTSILLCLSVNHIANATQPQLLPTDKNTLIPYCIDPDWLPYEAIKDGKHVGISADYMALLAQRTGLRFALVKTDTWQQTLNYLRSGRCQFTTMLNKTALRSEYLVFSDIYFRAPNVLVSTREQPFLQGFDNVGERLVAIPHYYRLLEYVTEYYPETKILLVANEKAGLQAVAEGTADLFIGSLYSVNAHIQRKQWNNLKISGWLRPEDELRMAVIPSQTHLLPLINKTIAEISEAEHLAIYENWNNTKVIDNTNYQLTWQVIGVAAVIVLLLSWRAYASYRYNRKLSATNKELLALRETLETTVEKLEFISQHDALTKLHNRSFFQQLITGESRHLDQQDKLSMVMLDIDHFKLINDTHGHTAGDQILIELAKLLELQIRDTDILARWGGEEFVILCPGSSLEDAVALCERMMHAIAAHEFSYTNPITCSFGVAEKFEAEALEACFERADKALYEAKASGRNRICTATDGNQ